MCTPVRVDFERNYYITGFEPNASMETAHHILIYGCTKPGSAKSVWNCGEMANAGKDPDTAPACQDGTQVINIKVRRQDIFHKYFLDILEEKKFIYLYRSSTHGQGMLLN